MFSPDLSQHWVSEQDAVTDSTPASAREDDALSPSQQEALEALVDRVTAARSII